MVHKWTEEHKQFLKDNVKGTPIHDLKDMFNEHFGTDLTYSQVRGTTKRLKLKNGIDYSFKQGHKSWNKGMSIINEKCKDTQFKKGNIPANLLPIGSERVNKDGYTLVKVSNEGSYSHRWKLKHRVMWENEYGEIPSDSTLIFLNGNKSNFDFNNLRLIKRSELARLNQQNLIHSDPGRTEVGINIVKLQGKVAELNNATK